MNKILGVLLLGLIFMAVQEEVRGTANVVGIHLWEKIGQEVGLDPDLLRAMCWKESSHDPMAVGLDGELGLCQTKVRTAVEMGLKRPYKRLLQAEVGARMGARYLKQWMGRVDNDVGRALHGYNSGKWTRKAPRTRHVRSILVHYRELQLIRLFHEAKCGIGAPLTHCEEIF